ncbi:MAG: amidase family protein [Erysipelotrichaceae bacterium]
MNTKKDIKDIVTTANKAIEDAKASQDKLNAVVTLCDIEPQIENLKTIDKNSKLYGVPVVLKDNISTKGIRTTACSNILKNYVPAYDATIVKKLRDAGSIFIAKSSMDELAMGGTNINANIGRCCNPYDTSRITGGSSGGSAALVAAGIVPLAIGSDTGDSIRKPAGYCGICGVKPTYGRISRYGIIPYASSLDTVGYFTSNVSDAATALEVLAGRDDLDMTSSSKVVENYSTNLNSDITGKKIAIVDNIYEAIKDDSILKEFDKLIDNLAKRGAIIKHVHFNQEHMEALLPTYLIIANAEATANHSNLDGIRFGEQVIGENVDDVMINSRTAGFSSEVRKRFVIGSYSLFVENQEKIFMKAQKVRQVIVNELKTIMADCDAIIGSSAGSVAPHPDDSYGEKLSCTYLVAENHMLLGNFSGFPSMSIPTALVNELPIGVNITTKAFEEQTMFNIAKAIEEECNMKDKCVEVIK